MTSGSLTEMAGVILVYFGRVMFLGATFSGPVCNAGITVVLACVAYVLSKAEKEKAKKSEVGDGFYGCLHDFHPFFPMMFIDFAIWVKANINDTHFQDISFLLETSITPKKHPQLYQLN